MGIPSCLSKCSVEPAQQSGSTVVFDALESFLHVYKRLIAEIYLLRAMSSSFIELVIGAFRTDIPLVLEDNEAKAFNGIIEKHNLDVETGMDLTFENSRLPSNVDCTRPEIDTPSSSYYSREHVNDLSASRHTPVSYFHDLLHIDCENTVRSTIVRVV